MTLEAADLLLELSRRRLPVERLSQISGAGIYSIYLQPSATLGTISNTADRPIYIGITASNLAVRNHFVHKQSGFSTFRRSIGAILKNELNLTASPRATGASRTNTRNFRFDLDGETRLSKWMSEHLLCSQLELTGNLKTIERKLVEAAKPLLNLTLWPNPYRQELRKLRDICKNEAAQRID